MKGNFTLLLNKEVVACCTTLPSLLVTNSHCKCYPSMFVVLCSVYDIQAPDEPLAIMNINTGDLSPAYSPSKTLVGPALGETSVAFDFGAAMTVQPKQSSLLKSPIAQPVQVWPVYCVRGNGDVMLLYSHLSHFR